MFTTVVRYTGAKASLMRQVHEANNEKANNVADSVVLITSSYQRARSKDERAVRLSFFQ